jgi:hypothetical protein
MNTMKLLDVIVLLEDIPEYKLVRGQTGTLVEPLAPGVWEVEFSDKHGQAYAMLALREDQMLKLVETPMVTSGT